jgi:hypothetical protein
MESSVISTGAKLDGMKSSLNDRARTLNQSLSTVNSNLTLSRRQQTTHFRHQKASNGKIHSQLNEIQSAITQITNISLRESGNDIIFEGENLGAIVLPLKLMQNGLAKAVETLSTTGPLRISYSEALWIQEEMENLLLCGHERSAQKLSRSQERKTWLESRSTSYDTFSSRAVSCATDNQTKTPDLKWMANFRALQNFQRRQVSTAAGDLIVETAFRDGKDETSHKGSPSFMAFQMSFVPKMTISALRMTASFFKSRVNG